MAPTISGSICFDNIIQDLAFYRWGDTDELIPMKEYHIFNKALLTVFRDPVRKFVAEVLSPMGKHKIPAMVQELIDNPIGNQSLENYWEHEMTVLFAKGVDNEKQIRFTMLLVQLKESIFDYMRALWYADVQPIVALHERLITQYVTTMITDELYIDEEAMARWTGSAQNVEEVGEASKRILQNICNIGDGDEKTIIPDLINAFIEAN